MSDTLCVTRPCQAAHRLSPGREDPLNQRRQNVDRTGSFRRDLPRGIVPRPLPFTEQKGTDMVPVPAQTCPPPGGPHTATDRSEEVSRHHRPEHTGRSPADRPG
jgi:hypothetical protein